MDYIIHFRVSGLAVGVFFVQHPNPIGSGLAMEAIVEAAGPECIVPGQITPIKLLGVKVLLFHQKDGLI